MRTYKEFFNAIANDLLQQNGQKPNYSNKDFMNIIIIFNTALMDKMYDNQIYIEMSMEDRMDMAQKCGESLREFVKEFTGIDTFNIEEYI